MPHNHKNHQPLLQRCLIFFNASWYFLLYNLFSCSSNQFFVRYFYKTDYDLNTSTLSCSFNLILSGELTPFTCDCTSIFDPRVDSKFDCFFLCELITDCISNVLLTAFEVAVNSLDLWLRGYLSVTDPERFPFRLARQQLCVDFGRDYLLSLLSLLRSRGYRAPLLRRSFSVASLFTLLFDLLLREFDECPRLAV